MKFINFFDSIVFDNKGGVSIHTEQQGGAANQYCIPLGLVYFPPPFHMTDMENMENMENMGNAENENLVISDNDFDKLFSLVSIHTRKKTPTMNRKTRKN